MYDGREKKVNMKQRKKRNEKKILRREYKERKAKIKNKYIGIIGC